jgi:hypothetical protein
MFWFATANLPPLPGAFVIAWNSFAQKVRSSTMRIGTSSGFSNALANSKASLSVKSPLMTALSARIANCLVDTGCGQKPSVEDDRQLAAHVVPRDLAKQVCSLLVEPQVNLRFSGN